MKKLIAFTVTTILTVSTAFESFAGAWVQNNSTWKWLNDDGTYARGCWAWLDGNKDGTAECYYFDNNGNMLANTTTPDGYTVNNNGAWTVNGVVQTKIASATSTTSAGSQTTGTVQNTSSPIELTELLFNNVPLETIELMFPLKDHIVHQGLYDVGGGSCEWIYLSGHIEFMYKNGVMTGITAKPEFAINKPIPTAFFGLSTSRENPAAWSDAINILKARNPINWYERKPTRDSLYGTDCYNTDTKAEFQYFENGKYLQVSIEGGPGLNWDYKNDPKALNAQYTVSTMEIYYTDGPVDASYFETSV